MRKLLSTLCMLTILSPLYAVDTKSVKPTTVETKTIKPTPVSYPIMSLKDIHGKTYKIQGTEEGLKIQGLQNKVVFLEFFGHQCPPCLASIPHLINLQKKYKDKLAIISIEVQGLNTQQVARFAKSKKMNYIVASDETASALIQYIQQRAQWRGSIPFLVALDTQGDVQFVQAGMLPESSLESLIHQLSEKPKIEENTQKGIIKTH